MDFVQIKFEFVIANAHPYFNYRYITIACKFEQFKELFLSVLYNNDVNNKGCNNKSAFLELLSLKIHNLFIKFREYSLSNIASETES